MGLSAVFFFLSSTKCYDDNPPRKGTRRGSSPDIGRAKWGSAEGKNWIERERESLEKTKPSIYCSVSHYLRQINITNLSFTTRTILPENTRQSFNPQNNDLGGEVVMMLNPALAVRYPSLIVMRCNKSLVEEQNHPSE